MTSEEDVKLRDDTMIVGQLEQLTLKILNNQGVGLRGTELALRVLCRWHPREFSNTKFLEVLAGLVQRGEVTEIIYLDPLHTEPKPLYFPKHTTIIVTTP